MATIKCDRCGTLVELGTQVECAYTRWVNKPDGTVEAVGESETLCEDCYGKS